MLYQTTPQQEALLTKIRDENQAADLYAGSEKRVSRAGNCKIRRDGLMGILFPMECGGAGLDVVGYAIAVEELSRVDGGTGVIPSAHVSLGSWPMFAFGTEAQKQKYLVSLASGKKIGAFF